MHTPEPPRYRIANLNQIPGVACPCGTAKRAFVEDADQIASLHVVEIKSNAQRHYHKKTTEIYYILEGTGHLELDDNLVPVKPGMSIMIKPGCRHRAIGQLKIINVPVPAFDPADEWLD